MLLSLSSLAITLLSASAGWLADGLGDGPLHSGNTPVTPRDPSTLVLALIGAGTIAIYLVAKRRPARTGAARWTGRLSDQSEKVVALDDVEQMPSRGAA